MEGKYSLDSDFVESMLLDMAYFYRLGDYEKGADFNSEMRNWYPGLCERLEFVIHRL